MSCVDIHRRRGAAGPRPPSGVGGHLFFTGGASRITAQGIPRNAERAATVGRRAFTPVTRTRHSYAIAPNTLSRAARMAGMTAANTPTNNATTRYVIISAHGRVTEPKPTASLSA